ncbi:MAG: adenine phosphoribosyltransferase [Weeksellaceae bacterium]|jgi:adenine phosphoribosyltransferase|nr:adenine phosphoribosyltransferase [Weeksellaceae bacterium]
MDTFTQLIDENIGRVPDFPSPGIQFKDISTLFQNPPLVNEIATVFATYSQGKVDAVCGIESRGFLFGLLIAQKLGLPFVLIRKTGKLPPPTVSESYRLEYGEATIEVQPAYIKDGMRFLIHDDVLATGGTAQATAKLIKKCGGVPAQFSFIAELVSLGGKQRLLQYSYEIQCLLSYE